MYNSYLQYTEHSSSFKYSRSTAVSIGCWLWLWLRLLRLTDRMPLSLASARTLSHIWPAQFCVHVLMNIEVHALTQSTTRFRVSCRSVYRSQIRDINQPKSRLIEEWEHFHQMVIDEAIGQWRPCFGACVRLRADGGYFEHRL